MYISFRNENHTAIRIARDNWRWILMRGDRNLSMHHQGLMRFKNKFSLKILKSKRAFFPILFLKNKLFITVFSIWTAKKEKSHFFVNIYLPWFLKQLFKSWLELNFWLVCSELFRLVKNYLVYTHNNNNNNNFIYPINLLTCG